MARRESSGKSKPLIPCTPEFALKLVPSAAAMSKKKQITTAFKIVLNYLGEVNKHHVLLSTKMAQQMSAIHLRMTATTQESQSSDG
jgi:hypothetical protein